MNLKNQDHGFVALISVLAISAVILAITVTAGASAFYARSNALQNEFKRQALSLAEACVNVALLNLREDYYYNPSNDVITLGSNTCHIESVSLPSGDFNREIRTWAEVNGSFSSVVTNATVIDPSLPPLPPPAACALSISPDNIDDGGSAWLSWATSTNADSFFITDRANGSVISPQPNTSGQELVFPDRSTTYEGSVSGPGGSGSCSAPISVGEPPDCADLVLMLDRTSNFSSSARSDEEAAAKGILNLFASTTDPFPQVGIGRFGDNLPGGIEAEIVPGVLSSTGFLSPTAEDATTGGDGDGLELYPLNALNDGISFAENRNGAGDRHIYYNYGITIPVNTTITGIEVRLDWWLPADEENHDTAVEGENSITVEISWNGGANWVSKISNDESTHSYHTDTVGSSSDLWGRSWVANDFSNNNFRVRLTMNCTGAPSCAGRDYALDWVSVRVYHSRSPIGWLSRIYGEDNPGDDNDGDLYDAIEEATGSASNVGSNLADAISVGAAELNGPRHLSGKRKVLLLVSDGDPDEPPNAAEAALDAADAAKLSGVEIFTVFYGSDPSGFYGQELLSALASGSVSASGLPSHSHFGNAHQSGSNDNFGNNSAGYASENTDGDYFFIAPSSSYLSDIFNSIAQLSCPAAGPSASATPPQPPPPPLLSPSNISIGSWEEI